MLPGLLLGSLLSLGQIPQVPQDLTSVEVAPLAPTVPERWLLMKELQGTYPGWLLDDNRLQIYGWTDVSFTASSAEQSNLPMGFNYRANEFAVQQNWLRFDALWSRQAPANPLSAFAPIGFCRALTTGLRCREACLIAS